MENNMMSLKISEDMIKGIVSQQIEQAIVRELGNSEEYMRALISLALHQKVSSSGSVSHYPSDNKFDYLDMLLKEQIQTAAKKALEEYIKENTDILKQALRKELEKESAKNKLVETFIEGTSRAFEYSWNFECNVNFKRNE